MNMSSNERWVPVFVKKLRDRCFCWFPAAMVVPLRWTPTFLLISRRWKIAPIWILAIVLACLTPLISQIRDLFLMACQLKLAIDKKDKVQSDQLAIGASLIKYFKVFKENFLSSILRNNGYNLIQMKLRKKLPKRFSYKSFRVTGVKQAKG